MSIASTTQHTYSIIASMIYDLIVHAFSVVMPNWPKLSYKLS